MFIWYTSDSGVSVACDRSIASGDLQDGQAAGLCKFGKLHTICA